MDENMVIVFDGDTLDLKDKLKQFSSATEKVTLDFMMRNFKIMEMIEVKEIDKFED